MRGISLHSRRKLKPGDAVRFTALEPGLFVELAKVVCSTGVVPQKELHESWQMACKVHQEFPDCLHVADLAAGHGLLAWILVLLARCGDAPVMRTAVAIDVRRPRSANILTDAVICRWPDLAGKVHYVEGSIDAVRSQESSRTLFVAAHACGSLSDRILLTAIRTGNPVALMPCCHSPRHQAQILNDLSLAAGIQPYGFESDRSGADHVNSIDHFRMNVLAACGYEIIKSSIQSEITKFNRIVMAKPLPTRKKITFSSHSRHPEQGNHNRAGAIHAYEKADSIDIDNLIELRDLALRPSCEWQRSFDLSYWVSDSLTGHRLVKVFEVLIDRYCSLPAGEVELASGQELKSMLESLQELLRGASAIHVMPTESSDWRVTIRDQYCEAQTQRLAFTYRFNYLSCETAITKHETNALRLSLCSALNSLGAMSPGNFEKR